MLTETALIQTLSARGYKLTRPRRAVMRALAEAATGLTPAEIHLRARKYYRQTGLVTVYRTLEVLAECGGVSKIHQADGCHTYALTRTGHAHHIICADCHSVAEFDNCDLEELIREVQQRTGYQIEDHWLELFGRCPACRARLKAR